jgi:hypothetical protein
MHELDEGRAVRSVGKGEERSRKDAELMEMNVGQLLIVRLCSTTNETKR